MLGRLVLILVQLGAGWLLAPVIAKQLPNFGSLTIFVLRGHFRHRHLADGDHRFAGAEGRATPSASTLTVALMGALIGAGLTMVPEVGSAIGQVIKGGLPTLAYPLIGAVLGYAIKRRMILETGEKKGRDGEVPAFSSSILRPQDRKVSRAADLVSR